MPSNVKWCDKERRIASVGEGHGLQQGNSRDSTKECQFWPAQLAPAGGEANTGLPPKQRCNIPNPSKKPAEQPDNLHTHLHPQDACRLCHFTWGCSRAEACVVLAGGRSRQAGRWHPAAALAVRESDPRPASWDSECSPVTAGGPSIIARLSTVGRGLRSAGGWMP